MLSVKTSNLKVFKRKYRPELHITDEYWFYKGRLFWN